MKKNVKMISVVEFLAMDTMVENYQRTAATGSHNKAYRKQFLNAICDNTEGYYCGTVTVCCVGGQYAILDGNSRKHTFTDLINEYKKLVEDADTDTLKAEYSATLAKLQNAQLTLVELELLTIEDRQKTFTALNSGKSLSGLQKNKGVLSADISECINQLQSFINANGIFTQSQILNDIATDIIIQAVANLNGVYNSNVKKIMIAISELETVIVPNVAEIVALWNETESEFTTKSKYQIISELTLLSMNGKLSDCCHKFGIEKSPNNSTKVSISDLKTAYYADCLNCSFDTVGANSAVKNVERFSKLIKKAVNVVLNSATYKAISVDDINIETINIEDLESAIG